MLHPQAWLLNQPTAKGGKGPGKSQNGTPLDENPDNANAAKAPENGKTDLKKPSEDGKNATKNGNDIGKPSGKIKGTDKNNLNDLFTPVSTAFNFYGGSGDNDLMMETGEKDTDGEENPKKRKNQPVPEPPSSEEDKPAEDPVLISNLISNANEANARSRELEQLVQGQEAKLRILARATSIPESEIENITLAQELTEEQIAEAQGEIMPSVAGASGSSGSTRIKKDLNQIQKQESLLEAQALQNLRSKVVKMLRARMKLLANPLKEIVKVPSRGPHPHREPRLYQLRRLPLKRPRNRMTTCQLGENLKL